MSSKLSRPKEGTGITLVLWLDEQERVRQFQLMGHAGFAAYGNDIICAGVSALSIAAVNGLEHFLPVAPEVEEADGYLTCQLPEITEQELNNAQWILQTMKLGIEAIKQTYGENYLTIERRRWTPC